MCNSVNIPHSLILRSLPKNVPLLDYIKKRHLSTLGNQLSII